MGEEEGEAIAENGLVGVYDEGRGEAGEGSGQGGGVPKAHRPGPRHLSDAVLVNSVP